MAFCENCGQSLEDGIKFCPTCGTATTASGIERKTVYDGELHKCPHCGEVLKTFDVVCPTCGFELRGTKGSSAVRELAEKLEQASTDRQRIIIIKNFPIPNTKEDIFEFMLLASSNFDASYYATHLDEEDISDAWLIKIEQCYQKAKLILKNTEDLNQVERIYNEIKNNVNDIHRKEDKKLKGESFKKYKKLIVIALGILIAIVATIVTIVSVINAKKKYEQDMIEAGYIKFGYDSFKLMDKEYTYVIDILETRGFTNVEAVAVTDKNPNGQDEFSIYQILINGETSFSKDNYIHSNDKILIKYYDFSQFITVGYSSSSLVGQQYDYVVNCLEAKGFTDISLDVVMDVAPSADKAQGDVFEIQIDGSSLFSNTSSFRKNAEIVITYYNFSNYTQINFTWNDIKGENYADVVKRFEALGFTNITLVTIDGFWGNLFKEEGAVEEVVVDGDSPYNTEEYYKKDVEIIIRYHTKES